jgi:hypothetical protein
MCKQAINHHEIGSKQSSAYYAVRISSPTICINVSKYQIGRDFHSLQPYMFVGRRFSSNATALRFEKENIKNKAGGRITILAFAWKNGSKQNKKS